MEDLKLYPRSCRKNLNRLMYMLSTDADTAYNMMRMTALLMDLDINDDKVISLILTDCCTEG